MVKDGLFERCPMEQVFGMHNWPGIPQGRFVWRDGPIMAAVANIEITVTGKGAHAAHPDLGIDPIVVASHIVTALQTIVSRGIDPAESGVVTIGHVAAGRHLQRDPRDGAYEGHGALVRARGRRRSWKTACAGWRPVSLQASGRTADVSFTRDYPATVNDPAATALTLNAARAVAGEANVQPMKHPTMGGEDFAFMLQAKQGSYIMLGGGREQGRRAVAPSAVRFQRRNPADRGFVLGDAGGAIAATIVIYG